MVSEQKVFNVSEFYFEPGKIEMKSQGKLK